LNHKSLEGGVLNGKCLTRATLALQPLYRTPSTTAGLGLGLIALEPR